MTGSEGRFTLTTGERVLATAERVGELWMITNLLGQEFSLVTLMDRNGTEVVLFDGALNAVVSLRQRGGKASSVTVMDARNTPAAIVREDGLGGLHVVDLSGNAMLFAGRNRMCANSLDLLITDAGAMRPIVSLFAIAVALEGEQLGPLHSSQANFGESNPGDSKRP